MSSLAMTTVKNLLVHSVVNNFHKSLPPKNIQNFTKSCTSMHVYVTILGANRLVKIDCWSKPIIRIHTCVLYTVSVSVLRSRLR